MYKEIVIFALSLFHCLLLYLFRYIVLEITPHNKDKLLMLKATAVHHAIQQKVQQLYGDFGIAAIKAGFNGNFLFNDGCCEHISYLYNMTVIISSKFKSLMIYVFHNLTNLFFVAAKYCNPYTKIALVKVRHGPHKFLLHTIPLINNISERRVQTNILYIGATMKHCFLFIKVSITM